jgi:hypothetical protein
MLGAGTQVYPVQVTIHAYTPYNAVGFAVCGAKPVEITGKIFIIDQPVIIVIYVIIAYLGTGCT